MNHSNVIIDLSSFCHNAGTYRSQRHIHSFPSCHFYHWLIAVKKGLNDYNLREGREMHFITLRTDTWNVHKVCYRAGVLEIQISAL